MFGEKTIELLRFRRRFVRKFKTPGESYDHGAGKKRKYDGSDWSSDRSKKGTATKGDRNELGQFPSDLADFINEEIVSAECSHEYWKK